MNSTVDWSAILWKNIAYSSYDLFFFRQQAEKWHADIGQMVHSLTKQDYHRFAEGAALLKIRFHWLAPGDDYSPLMSSEASSCWKSFDCKNQSTFIFQRDGEKKIPFKLRDNRREFSTSCSSCCEAREWFAWNVERFKRGEQIRTNRHSLERT